MMDEKVVVKNYMDDDRGRGRGGDDILGGGLGAVLVGGLLVNGFGGNRRNEGGDVCQSALIQMQSDFNASQQNQILSAVHTSAAAGIAATNHAAQIEAIRAVDASVCLTNTNINNGFSALDKSLCNAFGVTNANINAVNTQVLLQGKDAATMALATQNLIVLQSKDLSKQLSDCCCEIQMQATANTQKILDTMCADREQNLRDERDAERLENSQLKQTAILKAIQYQNECAQKDLAINFGTIVKANTNTNGIQSAA